MQQLVTGSVRNGGQAEQRQEVGQALDFARAGLCSPLHGGVEWLRHLALYGHGNELMFGAGEHPNVVLR